MKKIILITASIEDEQRSAEIQDNSHYPLGLGYLHSFLEIKGHKVTTLFLNDYAPQECIDMAITAIESINPDIVGLNLFTANRVCSFKLIERIHDTWPSINMVVGGIHATIMYEQILRLYPYLLAVLGEGEITISELADNKKAMADIDGIAFNDNGTIVKTKERGLIQDLDELPYPKHELFFNNVRRMGNILTSRGCPFLCTFCCLRSVSQRRVRYRSIGNVVDEIEHMIRKFSGMSSIWIHDDSFFLDNDRVVSFCNEIIRRQIKMEFICSGRMKPISKAMVVAMEKAGFTHVLFGLESGAKEILKLSKKAITKEDATNAIQLFAESPIEITAFLIVGLPGETLETIKETAEFFQSLQRIKYIWVGDELPMLFVYPGTEVYEMAKTKGFIGDDYWSTGNSIPIYTAEHSIEILNEFKSILLNHITIGRMFTKSGYSCQKRMIPLIFRDKYFRRKLANAFFSLIINRSTINRFKRAVGLDRKTRKARIASIKRMLGTAVSS